MRILFYSPVKLEEGGGCERWHCDIANSLKEQFGDEVEITTGNLGSKNWSKDYLKKQLAGIAYTRVNFPIILNILIPTPIPFGQLYKKFKRADVVHFIHGFFGQDLMILVLKVLTGKKVIAGHHAPILHQNKSHNLQMKYVSRWFLNFFDSHMTLNISEKKFLEKEWKVKNVHFIPSGIRLERFSKLPRKLHKKLNFLTVGIYRKQKGFDLLVRAIEKFNFNFPNNKAIFRLVGKGELDSLISEFTKKHKNIFNLGYLEYEKMPKIYQISDIFLSTSREEPFGLVLVEAMAAGLPIIATKTFGAKGMVEENKNGWFIKRVDVDSIYQLVARIYKKWVNNARFLREMESYCKKTAKKFSIDVTADRMRKELFL